MLQRLEVLEENIHTLKKLQKAYSLEDIKKNRLDEWSLRYGIFESIQVVIDIACHLVSKYNLGSAKSYVACIEILQKYAYIDERLAKSLVAAVGLRNLLIHEYIQIDVEKLYGFLEYVDDFSRFIKSVREYV